MPRARYENDLRERGDLVLALGSMAEKATLNAMEALHDGDTELSRQVIDHDREINKKRFEIEDRCLFVIASQAPVASDLRYLASMFYISTDLERIADHAADIAKINIRLGDEPVPRRLGRIASMADHAVAMLHHSLEAFVRRDAEFARRISAADNEVDRLRDTVYSECLRSMAGDPASIRRGTHRIWTAHRIERIADRCTNMCERVIYTVTGRMQELNVSKQ